MFDPRLLRMGIEIGGELVWYEDLAMECSVTKTTTVTANDATMKITNIDKDRRNRMLTETTPYNTLAKRKQIIVEAGRESYGYSRIFVGDIVSATPSQPPDIALSIKARTNEWNKLQPTAKAYGPTVTSGRIAQDVADDMGLALVYTATDRQIASYSFTGTKAQQLHKLSDVGRVNAYIDDGQLIVKDVGTATPAPTSAVLDLNSGMVGIPEVTEQGIKVKMLFDPTIKCGAKIPVRSLINPSANGEYIIFKITYDLANRMEPFYSTIEAYKLGRYLL